MEASGPIEVEGLSHFYGKGSLRKQVLFDISATIPAGQIVIVTGPSGSGKTTLLTIIGALRAAQAGSVRILGRELTNARPRGLERARREIGFIFQQHNLLGALSALQNVELGVRVSGRVPRREVGRRAREMLDAVGLADRIHHRPAELSGGQRQRVAIARALVSHPSILLADEPTASLDKESGREVVERMQTLAREQGTTILLVTHDNRILDVADRIMHLEDGRLQTFTEAVISNTRHMMHLLAENRRKEPLDEVIAELDESGFRAMLDDLTRESQKLLESIGVARDEAVQGMLAQALDAFARKLTQIMGAERASLFLVDRETDTLWLRVTQDQGGGDLRIPAGTGIAGAALESGQAIRVDDAYADARFNPEMDRRTGFRTRSMLCLPVRDRDGRPFAVAQLLNRRDGRPFDDRDQRQLEVFMEPLAVILEAWQKMALLRSG